jgi:ribA/ribD-fused uncharacterized protein
MINQFKGKHDFLSNFHPSVIEFQGIVFPTVEHAFQAAKTQDPEVKLRISQMSTPGKAKRAAGKKGIVKDFNPERWDKERIGVMLHLIRLKFQIPELRQKLLETGELKLVEGNNWNDTFWGVSLKTGNGKNFLGRILELVRKEIRNTEAAIFDITV